MRHVIVRLRPECEMKAVRSPRSRDARSSFRGSRSTVAIALALSTLSAGRAVAAPITSATDPALQGAVVVDFESAAPGIYAAFAGGLSVATTAGTVNVTGPRLQVASTYAGQYNMSGQYVSSEGYLFRNVIVTFPVPVRAFGFNVGLTSQPWELHAYDAAGNDVETVTIPPTFGSNDGDFVGITSSTDIAEAVFVVQLPLHPGPLWAVIDNLAFRGGAAKLDVSRLGHGDGTVGSAPAGIDCGITCTAPFVAGTSVELSATPADGSFFGGWGGACAGSEPASTVVVGGATGCTATFHLLSESADLRLEAKRTTARARPGHRVTHRLTTTNHGPATADATILAVALDGLAGPDAASISAPAACTVSDATVTCALQSLAPGRRKSITIRVTPSTNATLELRAAVTSGAPDPTPGDATATLTTSLR